MKLIWLLLALTAVAAPAALAADTKVETDQTELASHWREKAIELLEKGIARLEDVIAKLPEGSKLRPALTKALNFLRKKLTDLQDASVAFSEVNRSGVLQGILDRLEQAIDKIPEGPLRDRLQQAIDKIRDLLNSVRPNDAIVVNDRIRELIERIRRLIETHKEAGKAALLRFLNSDVLERMVNALPEPIQSEVRDRISKLKDRLEADDLTVSDWRAKAIELLEKGIARLEDVIAKLPEGSKLKPALTKVLGFLRKKLTDLQDAAMTFSDADRSGILQKVLAKLEEAIAKLPEGRLRDRLQQAIDKIRDLLN